MDFNQAMVFVRVVEAGSFTAAAQRLAMPKSTVSRRVSQLEERLGVRLLQRTTRQLHLTQEGEAYYRQAASALSSLEDAEHAVLRSRELPRGLLRVTAPVDLSGALGGLVARFRSRYPEVSVIVDVTQRKMDLIAEGYDVAIRGGSLPDSSLVARRLHETEFGLYASESYLRSHGEPASLSDLVHHRCLLFGHTNHEVWRLNGPKGTEEIALSGCVASNDFTFLQGAAIAGGGITMVSRRRGMERVLRRVLPEYSWATGSVYAVYPSSRHLIPRVRVFVDFLAEHLGEQVEDLTLAALPDTANQD